MPLRWNRERENVSLAVDEVIFSIYHPKTNLTFGHSNLSLINCSNFPSCSSCTTYSKHCLWNLPTVQCQDQTSFIAQRKRAISNVSQCPRMYLQHSINRLPLNTNQTLIIHFDQCDQPFDVNFCQLNDYRKRLQFLSSTATWMKIPNVAHLCLLKCAFELIQTQNLHPMVFHRPLHLDLSVQSSNETLISIPRSHTSLYHCERMALNCTSCSQLDSSFGCVWCNNRCMLKSEATTQEISCVNRRECLVPIIDSVEPLLLPINGGTMVTIHGKHFDLFNLTITLADVPCRLIREESSNDK